jgi:hypothetical protein
VTDDALRDLAALAALETLEGEEAEAFAAVLPSSSECRRELFAFQRAVRLLPLGLRPVPVAPRVRDRVLAAALGERPARTRTSRAWLGLAAAASLVCAAGWWQARVEGGRARAEGVLARAETEAARAAAADAQRRLQQAELQLAAALGRGVEQDGLLRLVGYHDARLSLLSGLQAAPAARGRVLWSRSRREAFLVTTGLPAAPQGMGYEVWVIGRGAPVPAGVFQVDKEGGAVFRLPRLTQTAEAKTFAVTLEPAAGTPAPTGPMVLAGSAS